MKITCEFCRRIYEPEEGNCPGCGAYNPPPEEPPQPPPPFQESAPPPKKKQSAGGVLGVLLLLVVAATWFVPWKGNPSSKQELAPAASTKGSQPSLSIEELYAIIDSDPENHEAVVQAVKALYQLDRAREAKEVSLLLFSRGVEDAECFRAVGAIMAEQGEADYGIRMCFAAYRLTGDPGDLERAQDFGSPVDQIPDGPTAQSLEFLFHKQMRQITWEEIGQIRYFYASRDYIQLGLFTSQEKEFEDSLCTVRFDSGSDAQVSRLFGLEELSGTGSWEREELFGLQGLRSLTMPGMPSTASDLSGFEVLPRLEELYIGGSGISSLQGLDSLPRLRLLSLSGTSVENLSLLASYKNIEKLHLVRNKNLTSINSLEQMRHLKALRIERQEILDFQVLGNMEQLEELVVRDTGIKDFYFLSQLTELRRLTVKENSDLKSVAGIGSLVQLEELTVDDIDGLEEIKSLERLESVSLTYPQTLAMLSSLPNLKHLDVYGAGRLKDIRPVATLGSLESFALSMAGGGGYAAFSLEPLAGLPNLTRVVLGKGDYLGNNSGLLASPSLEYLDATGCRLAMGTAGFSGLTGIKTLKISGVKPVHNVKIYSDGFFTSIDYDELDLNRIGATLAGLKHLARLELAGTELTDISFVRELPALEYLDVSGGYITEIAVLGEVLSLRTVNLAGNPVRDWSASESWPGVYVIR